MDAISVRDLVDKYDRELVRLGYKGKSLKNYRVFWNQIVRYFNSNDEMLFSEATSFRFLDDRYNLSKRLEQGPLTRNEQYVRQMVRKLVHFRMSGQTGRRNRVPQRSIRSEDFAEVLGQYAQLCLDKGYAQSTRNNLRHHAIGFFMFLESNSVLSISEVSSETIVNYVNSLPVRNYHSVGLSLTCLRSLLQFLHTNGYHGQDLRDAVPHQQWRPGSSIPSTWNQEDVLALLEAIDRGNPCGKRDYAIILLVARLGLRAGDVRTLKLENLKWDTNRIEFVQSKTSKHVSLPLLKDLGWAIIDYLRNGRPESDCPYVFLRHTAPHGPVSEGNCFYHIVSRCMRVANMTASFRRKLGLHSLRHTLATRLLEMETPLSTISGILGHGSVESTSAYLKTTTEALRHCALGSPGSVR